MTNEVPGNRNPTMYDRTYDADSGLLFVVNGCEDSEQMFPRLSASSHVPLPQAQKPSPAGGEAPSHD